VEIKKCPKCGDYPFFKFKDKMFYLRCLCGNGICVEFSCSSSSLNEVIVRWNKCVEEFEIEISKQKELPKTFEECCYTENDFYYCLNESACSVQKLPYPKTVFINYNKFKSEKYARRFGLFLKLTLAAERYNDGWVWDGKSEYSTYNSSLDIYNTYNPYFSIKFKSYEIAKEFLKNFEKELKEFYLL
jgi:hypothetical protein